MKALVFGGSGSGKSAFAEDLSVSVSDRRVYLATMLPSGEEGKARVAKHRAARENKAFVTIEYGGNPGGLRLSESCGCLLLEDAGNLMANAIFRYGLSPEEAPERLFGGIKSLLEKTENIVIVSVDIFSGGASYPEETENYLGALAKLNSLLAAWADTVTEVVCGLPVYLKR